MPLTTILMVSRVKRVGRFTEGTGISVKQYVCLHLVQRKWTCKSSGWNWQVSLHNAYFTEPVPSSILWMSLFSSKVLSVRYKVTLSAFLNFCSRSAIPMTAPHSSSHTEYFSEPEPSSIVCTIKCCWNNVKVLNNVDLSIVSNSASKSNKLKISVLLEMAPRANSHQAVGLIPLFTSLFKYLFFPLL